MSPGPITSSYERLVNEGKVGIRYDIAGNRILFSERSREQYRRRYVSTRGFAVAAGTDSGGGGNRRGDRDGDRDG